MLRYYANTWIMDLCIILFELSTYLIRFRFHQSVLFFSVFFIPSILFLLSSSLFFFLSLLSILFLPPLLFPVRLLIIMRLIKSVWFIRLWWLNFRSICLITIIFSSTKWNKNISIINKCCLNNCLILSTINIYSLN